MEFPELLSVLLYKDCGAEVTSDLPRLQTLATANGKNPTLVLYLLFFKKTGRCPNPNELVSFGNTVPQFSIEQIADELELADAINKQGNAGYEMEFAQAWEKAHDLYVSHGHQVASAILQQIIPQDIDKRKIIKLFGEDQANWKWAEYAKVWWTEYDAANPFVKREAEEVDPANEHEYVFATGVDSSGDEVENTTLTVINATDIKPEQLNWLWPERIPQGIICWFTGKPNLGEWAINYSSRSPMQSVVWAGWRTQTFVVGHIPIIPFIRTWPLPLCHLLWRLALVASSLCPEQKKSTIRETRGNSAGEQYKWRFPQCFGNVPI